VSKLNKREKKKKVNYDMGENIHDEVHTRRINWFPGHMNKAIRQIKERLKRVDIVLEIRDARSPLTTGNTAVHEAIGEKSVLIVFNKTNLADPKVVVKWEEWFATKPTPFIFINAFDKTSLSKITENAKKIVHAKRLQSNPEGVTKTDLKMMIIGLPNTGKSTIINKLANRNATKAADRPGLTQQQLWVKVDSEMQVLDTPGVMPPKIDNYKHGLWLAALHCIPKTIVKHEDSACFIIQHLLDLKSEYLKNHYKMETIDTDLVGALNQIAKARGCVRHKGEFDYDRVYNMVLNDFRSGELGPVSLGLPPIIKK
jgi:ribosome biogenesis GTPase A